MSLIYVFAQRGEVQWTRNGFGLGNERELMDFQRYAMIGSDEEGKHISHSFIAYISAIVTLLYSPKTFPLLPPLISRQNISIHPRMIYIYAYEMDRK